MPTVRNRFRYGDDGLRTTLNAAGTETVNDGGVLHGFTGRLHIPGVDAVIDVRHRGRRPEPRTRALSLSRSP